MPSQKKTAIVAPTKKPTAFVVPSIIVDPGTPHFTKKSPFVSKESDQDIIKSSITNEDKDGRSDTTTDQTDSFSIEKSSSPSPPPPLIILQNVPKFEIHEEETDYENNEIKNSNIDIENGSTSNNGGGLDVHIEKSRRFSKLPPAPKDSPNAVKLGSKFTKIEIPDKEEKVKINQAVEQELKDEFSESVEIMEEISDQNVEDVKSEVIADTLNVHVEKSRRFR